MIVVSSALVHVESRPVLLANGSGANIRLTRLDGRAIVRRGPCDGKLIQWSLMAYALLEL